MTEIVRAGIIAVDPGQMEAARSLGMTYGKAMRRIVLPQAARVIVPPLGQRVQQHAQDDLAAGDHQRARAVRRLLDGSSGNFFAPFEFFLAAAVWYPAADDHLGRHPGHGSNGGSDGDAGRREAAEHARAAVRLGTRRWTPPRSVAVR